MPAKFTSTAERFILEFGAHVEYVSLEVSGEDNILVEDKIIHKLNDQYRPGYWMWNKVPVRLPTNEETHCCAETRDGAGARLFPEFTSLRTRLDNLCVDTSSDAAENTQESRKREDGLTVSKKRKDGLTELKEVAGLLDDDFKKEVAFLREVENFTYQILKGIDELSKRTTPETSWSLIHILIRHRKSPDNELQLALEGAAALDSKKRQSVLWSSKILALTTRVVLRGLDKNFSETGDKGKEYELKKRERVPKIVNAVVSQIFAKKGGEALLIYSALEAIPQDFYEVSRIITEKEKENRFVRLAAERLESVDFSTVPGSVDILFHLAVVCWTKRLNTLCELLGLERLKGLDVGLVKKLDALEAEWAHKTDTAAWEKKSEQEKEEDRAVLEARASRDMRVPLQTLRDLYPASTTAEPAVDSGGALTGNQPVAGTTLDDLATLAEAARPLPLPQTSLCLPEPNHYPDSGYVTDSGDNLALTQNFNTACYTETAVAPASLMEARSTRNQSSSPHALNHREAPGTLPQVPLGCRHVDAEDSQPAAKRQKIAPFQTPLSCVQGAGTAAQEGSATSDRTDDSGHEVTELENNNFERPTASIDNSGSLPLPSSDGDALGLYSTENEPHTGPALQNQNHAWSGFTTTWVPSPAFAEWSMDEVLGWNPLGDIAEQDIVSSFSHDGLTEEQVVELNKHVSQLIEFDSNK